MQDFLWKGYTTDFTLVSRVFFWQNTSYFRKPPQITSCGGSAYPLHLSPWYTLDHNYFIEAPGQVGNRGMSRLQAVVNAGRDRSNEIKPNHIKCRVLVGGKTVSAGSTATHTWRRGRNRTQTTLMKGMCSSQCVNPGSHSFPSAIDQGLKEIFEARWLLINLYKFLVVF